MQKNHFKSWILYEDEDYIVINKPALITSLSTTVHPFSDILTLARTYHAPAQLCHRLDKEVSGALALAKHNQAYKALCKQFEQRQVMKTYHAIVQGIHHLIQKQVTAPIYMNSKNQAKIHHTAGKPATTIFQQIKIFKGYTLLACLPITGRTHQIRVHASYMHAPLVGDTKYGGQPLYLSQLKRLYKSTVEQEQSLIKRLPLHAYILGFQGLNAKQIVVQAPYPKDFQGWLSQLNKYAGL